MSISSVALCDKPKIFMTCQAAMYQWFSIACKHTLLYFFSSLIMWLLLSK